MAFKKTDWEYSDVVDNTQIPVSPGPQYLFIRDARFNKEDTEFTMTVQSLTNDAEFNLRYWLTSRDQNGAIIPNSKARGTLISLGTALAGEPIGIPNPVDIVGGVVLAEVTMSKPNDKGNTYPRVYSFQPVPEEIMTSFSNIEQYFE
jgi:hypothetical protein